MKAKDILEKFLVAWREKDWNKMFNFVQVTWKSKTSNTVETLEAFFSRRELKEYKIESGAVPLGFKEVVRDFQVFVTYKVFNGIEREGRICPRLICETEPYNASLKGEWGVNPIGVLRSFAEIEKINGEALLKIVEKKDG